jgi:hypothetical protein
VVVSAALGSGVDAELVSVCAPAVEAVINVQTAAIGRRCVALYDWGMMGSEFEAGGTER